MTTTFVKLKLHAMNRRHDQIGLGFMLQILRSSLLRCISASRIERLWPNLVVEDALQTIEEDVLGDDTCLFVQP